MASSIPLRSTDQTAPTHGPSRPSANLLKKPPLITRCLRPRAIARTELDIGILLPPLDLRWAVPPPCFRGRKDPCLWTPALPPMSLCLRRLRIWPPPPPGFAANVTSWVLPRPALPLCDTSTCSLPWNRPLPSRSWSSSRPEHPRHCCLVLLLLAYVVLTLWFLLMHGTVFS
jgi:hypothetical protein